MTGAFSPLTGFMSRADYDSVCGSMRLENGIVWPIPIVLDVSDDLARKLAPDAKLALRDLEGRLLAALHVEDVWTRDPAHEAREVFGTQDSRHRGVDALRSGHASCVGGRVIGLELPAHYDFPALRRTPAQLREEFAADGWNTVVAFETPNAMHRAHVELTMRALSDVEGAPPSALLNASSLVLPFCLKVFANLHAPTKAGIRGLKGGGLNGIECFEYP